MSKARLALLTVAASVVYAGAIAVSATSNSVGAGVVAAAVAAGVSFTATGIVAIARRPENRTGTLMLLVGFLWATGALSLTDSSALFTIGALTQELAFVPLAALLLSYPTGVLERGYHRVLVAALGLFAAAGPLLVALVDRRPTDCDTCPPSAIVVHESHGLSVAAQIGWVGGALAIALLAVVELVRRYLGAGPPLRRTLAPVYAMFALAVLFLIVSNAAEALSHDAATALGAVAVLFIALVPIAFLAGLLRSRLARGSVLQLLTALEEGIPLQAALAAALGDPSLEIAYWIGGRSRWVDAEGKDVSEPAADGRGSVTTVERHGERVAALVHDVSLDDQPELVRGVAAAAALSLAAERAQAELRSQYAYLVTLVDTAPSLLVTVDLEGRIVNLNGAAVEAAGCDREEEVRSRSFWDVFLDPGEREAIRERFAAAAPDHPAAEYENAFTNGRGEQRVIDWRTAPVRDEEGRVVSVVAGGLDVTERLRREEDAREAEERFRAIVESAPVAIIEIGLDNRVNLWNPAAKRIFGWSADEVLGRAPLWVPDDLQEEFRALSAREALGDAYTGYETVRVDREGRRLDVEIAAAPIRDAAGEVVGAMAVITDISERKQQAEEVRASRARIVRAADEARQKLERNLHDGAQQRLVALSVSLRLAEVKLSSDPRAAGAILEGARDELALALEELRELARGIHPALLTEHGLAAAVDALVARTPLRVRAELPDERLPPAIEAALYYVVSESLTNVAKYAGASAARVQVETSGDDVVRLEVSDDGVGGADPSRGSGLRGLADRVEALDGRLVVESPPGGGTRVRVTIPLVSVRAR